MNDLLLSEIKTKESALVNQLSMLEEEIFSSKVDIDALLKDIVVQCQESIEGIDDTMAQAEIFINELYVSQLFIDNTRHMWPVLAHRLMSAVEHRILAPVVKAAIIQRIANDCGFEADVVYVPKKVMVRIICDDVYSIIFDPVSGESLNWQELEQGLDDLGGDPSQMFLAPMEQESIVVEYLTSLKVSLINELQFEKALKCVDLLIAMKPDSPFERRDRGFLLHQLDCFKVAYDDYQYFVEHCPQDPAAQILKLQLDKISVKDTVLH